MHKDSWHIMYQVTFALVFMRKKILVYDVEVTFALDVSY